MSIVLDASDLAVAPIDQTSAQQIAQAYLGKTLGVQASTNAGVRTRSTWRFLIQYQATDLNRPLVVGRLDVNAQTGEVTPLTPTEMGTLHGRLAILLADLRGIQPVDKNGYVTPSLAKRNVKGYLGQYISIFACPVEEPRWIAGDSPYWCVTVVLPQAEGSAPCQLGTIKVDAQTGKVIPLTNLQMAVMQRHVQNVSPRSPQRATMRILDKLPIPLLLYQPTIDPS